MQSLQIKWTSGYQTRKGMGKQGNKGEDMHRANINYKENSEKITLQKRSKAHHIIKARVCGGLQIVYPLGLSGVSLTLRLKLPPQGSRGLHK